MGLSGSNNATDNWYTPTPEEYVPFGGLCSWDKTMGSLFDGVESMETPNNGMNLETTPTVDIGIEPILVSPPSNDDRGLIQTEESSPNNHREFVRAAVHVQGESQKQTEIEHRKYLMGHSNANVIANEQTKVAENSLPSVNNAHDISSRQKMAVERKKRRAMHDPVIPVLEAGGAKTSPRQTQEVRANFSSGLHEWGKDHWEEISARSVRIKPGGQAVSCTQKHFDRREQSWNLQIKGRSDQDPKTPQRQPSVSEQRNSNTTLNGEGESHLVPKSFSSIPVRPNCSRRIPQQSNNVLSRRNPTVIDVPWNLHATQFPPTGQPYYRTAAAMQLNSSGPMSSFHVMRHQYNPAAAAMRLNQGRPTFFPDHHNMVQPYQAAAAMQLNAGAGRSSASLICDTGRLITKQSQPGNRRPRRTRFSNS